MIGLYLKCLLSDYIYIYIKLKSYLYVCLSIQSFVTLITPLVLLTSTYQLSTIINSSFSYLKFVTTSECGDQIAFGSGLKTKKWRKLEQHSIENHSHMAQLLEQLTCIQEVAGSNPGGEQIFFFENKYFLHTRFFKIQL